MFPLPGGFRAYSREAVLRLFVTSDFSYTLDKMFGLLADRIGDSRRLMEETCIDCALRKDSISTATDRIERKGLRP